MANVFIHPFDTVRRKELAGKMCTSVSVCVGVYIGHSFPTTLTATINIQHAIFDMKRLFSIPVAKFVGQNRKSTIWMPVRTMAIVFGFSVSSTIYNRSWLGGTFPYFPIPPTHPFRHSASVRFLPCEWQTLYKPNKPQTNWIIWTAYKVQFVLQNDERSSRHVASMSTYTQKNMPS